MNGINPIDLLKRKKKFVSPGGPLASPVPPPPVQGTPVQGPSAVSYAPGYSGPEWKPDPSKFTQQATPNMDVVASQPAPVHSIFPGERGYGGGVNMFGGTSPPAALSPAEKAAAMAAQGTANRYGGKPIGPAPVMQPARPMPARTNLARPAHTGIGQLQKRLAATRAAGIKHSGLGQQLKRKIAKQGSGGITWY
jgi:hypothetical protein